MYNNQQGISISKAEIMPSPRNLYATLDENSKGLIDLRDRVADMRDRLLATGEVHALKCDGEEQQVYPLSVLSLAMGQEILIRDILEITAQIGRQIF